MCGCVLAFVYDCIEFVYDGIDSCTCLYLFVSEFVHMTRRTVFFSPPLWQFDVVIDNLSRGLLWTHIHPVSNFF